MKSFLIKNKVVLLSILAIIVLIGAFYAGCMMGAKNEQEAATSVTTEEVETVEEETTEEVVEEVEQQLVSFTVNDTVLDIDFLADNNTKYDAEQLTTEFANAFTLVSANGVTVEVNGISLAEGESLEIELEKLSLTEFIEVTLTEGDTTKNFYIRTLHSAATFTTEGESTDGYYYFDYNNLNVKMDSTGEVVFYKYVTTGRSFKRIECDGEVYYGYLTWNDECEVASSNAQPMKLVIMDSTYTVVDEVITLSSDMGIVEGHSLENHEFQMIELGHYIITGYVGMEVDNIPEDVYDGETALVTAAVVQEIKDGELLFQWNSTDYPELYGYSTDGCDYGSEDYQDYMHMNSVIVDPSDDNIIISIRSIDGIVKVDSTTGEIIWILGGLGDDFGITDEQQFSRQHFATISINGTLTIHDNGRESEQTRTLEFTLDEENMTITDFDAFVLDGYYSSLRGSTQRLSEEEDIFVISWGGVTNSTAIITEYNFTTDEVIFEVYNPFEISLGNIATSGCSYRVFKSDN